ncbi:MAG: glycosyltransferase family 39 protein [Myxococcota bacterium]|nr:glycosyltransferase family 39 protein [Myxococcota bacterium]
MLRSPSSIAVICLILASLFWSLELPSAHGATVSGTVQDPSPVAVYEVWLVTDLDLSTPGQPVARAEIDPTSGEFTLDWEGRAGAPFWVLLHERFAPRGGPPVDLYLPYDLLPFTEDSQEGLELISIDPVLLMSRERMSTEAPVLIRWLTVTFLILLSGFGLRFRLRKAAAPEGARSAPLADSAAARPLVPGEALGIGTILVIGLLLRFRGFFGESLDLLEVSYLPGIGRPSPFAEGATGLAAVPRMLEEMAQLYCLDLVHPPLYHLLMGIMRLFGEADWLLRIPALAASLATCWLLWSLMRRWSVTTGLASAAIFSIAGPSIYFGQDATPYAAVGLIAVASVILLLKALERGTTRLWLGYFVVLTLGFFCHYNLALLGVAEIFALLALAWLGRADRRWAAAVHRSMGPALAIAAFPLLWIWLHFSTFPTVAQDTRLVADTYAPDPGWFSFLWDFYSVNGGLDAGTTHWAGAASVPLLLLALHRTLTGNRTGRRLKNREAGILLAVVAGTFLVSVAFFYLNVREHLSGRVFYGFRWVGWSHPVILGLVVLGATRGAGHWLLRYSLATLWVTGLLLASWNQVSTPSRPDYKGVSDFIRENMQDRDAIATLPAWFQRGNLSHYLLSSGRIDRAPEDGEGVWLINDKRIIIESVHPSLPFETTARNSHFDRLWVAKVDERMSGRAKFSESIADHALDWADAKLILQRRWSDRFDRIELSLYQVPERPLQPPPNSVFEVEADRTVLNHRTYPPTGVAGFLPPAEITPAPSLGRTLAYQSPMTPGCVDWPFQGLKKSLDPDAPNHWYLLLRLPHPRGQRPPAVQGTGSPQLEVQNLEDSVLVRAVGGPCSGPPLKLRVTY